MGFKLNHIPILKGLLVQYNKQFTFLVFFLFETKIGIFLLLF